MKRNSVFPRCTTLFGLVLLALLSGCGQWQTVTPRTLVGTLETSGQNVWLNGKPGSSGMEVYNGDEVSTGPESQAYVYFSSGGFIHIDENTDPIFEWLKEGTCIISKIGRIRSFELNFSLNNDQSRHVTGYIDTDP